jgi:hypothetical protein
VPERCPECDGLGYGQAPSAADPALARRMACAICGWDAYLTSDVVLAGEPGRAASSRSRIAAHRRGRPDWSSIAGPGSGQRRRRST